MTFRNNNNFQFVTAVLLKPDFSPVGTRFSPFIFAYACSYLRDRFLALERSNDFLNEVLDIKPNDQQKSDKFELHGKTLIPQCFRNTGRSISNGFTVRLKIYIHNSPILKETSCGSIHKHSFSGKFALTSLILSPLSLAAELNTGSKLSVIRRHRYPLPLQGFSGYQWPSNFFVSFFTTSSPNSCTRRRGSLLTR